MPFRPDESSALFSIMSFNEPSFDPTTRSHASGDLGNFFMEGIAEDDSGDLNDFFMEGIAEEKMSPHREICVEDLAPPPLAYLSSPDSSPDGTESPRKVIRTKTDDKIKINLSSKPSRGGPDDGHNHQSSRRRSGNNSSRLGSEEGSSGDRRKSRSSSASPHSHRSSRRCSAPNYGGNTEGTNATSSASPHRHRSSRRLSAPNKTSESVLTSPGGNSEASSGSRRASSAGGTSRRNLLVTSELPGVYSNSKNHDATDREPILRRRLSGRERRLTSTNEEKEENFVQESPRRSSRGKDFQTGSSTLAQTTRASRRNLLAETPPPPPPDFRTPSPLTNGNRKSLARSASEDNELLKSAGSSASNPSRRSLLTSSSKDTPRNGPGGRKLPGRAASDEIGTLSRSSQSRRNLLQQPSAQSPATSTNRRQSDSRSRSPSHSRRSVRNSASRADRDNGHRRSHSTERKRERSRSADRKSSSKGTRSRSKTRDRRSSTDDGSRRDRRATSPKDRKPRARSKSRDASTRRSRISAAARNKKDPPDAVASLFAARAAAKKLSPYLFESNEPQQLAHKKSVCIAEDSPAWASPRREVPSPRSSSSSSPYILSQKAYKDKKEESKARRSSIMKSLKDLLMEQGDQENLKLEVQQDGTRRLVMDLSDLHSVMEEFGIHR